MEYVTVYANLSETFGQILKKSAAAQLKVSDEAFSDCTKYCKKDTGKLMASGKVNRRRYNDMERRVRPSRLLHRQSRQEQKPLRLSHVGA